MTLPNQSPSVAPPEAFGPFRLEVERLGRSGLLLTVAGELDMATAPQLRARLDEAFAAGVTGLAIDLRPVGFLDSIALATMLHARRELGDEGRMAIVIASDSYAQLIFEVAGLPQCLDLFESREAAVAHIAG